MVTQLVRAMEDPISNFGAQNVPRCLKAVEILGILQGRKWEVGTLNDFRDLSGMPRHKTLESIAKDPSVQNALRDLYHHPDKVELYPGIFCEGGSKLNHDPGPSDISSALWEQFSPMLSPSYGQTVSTQSTGIRTLSPLGA